MGFDWITSWLGGGGKPEGPSRRARLGCERLEDRWVPAGTRFLWKATYSNTWDEMGNWSYETSEGWLPALYDWPGRDGETGDSVVFGTADGANADCTMNNATTLAAMQVVPGYTATIYLKNGLTIAETFVMQSAFTLRGHRPLGGPRGGVGVAAPGTLTWTAGTLYDIDVGILGNPGGTPATLAVPAATGVREQKNSTITVGGLLNWSAGDVPVPPTVAQVPKSLLVVNGDGRVNITGQAGQWGLADPGRLEVLNSGTVSADLPAGRTATVVGDYTTNDLDARTRVRTGTLALAGRARQAAGQTELEDNGTLKLTSASRQYQVLGGSVLGNGTVDGKLAFFDAGTLSPGSEADEVGRIIITESLTLSTNSSVRIGIGFGADDFVEVRGFAALNGTLEVVSAAGYRPGVGTQLVFMSAAGGFRGNFTTFIFAPSGWMVGNRYRFWRPQYTNEFYWVEVFQTPP
ncbi:MAG: hypothetical protein K2X82_18915 [Gemmataceae bacterium]|nr:hypothetical protein [Gemmataceae bacterium]